MANKLIQFLICCVVSLGVTSCIVMGMYLVLRWKLSSEWWTTLVGVVVATSVTFLLQKMSLRSFFKLMKFLICLVVSWGIAIWIVLGIRVYHLPAHSFYDAVDAYPIGAYHAESAGQPANRAR